MPQIELKYIFDSEDDLKRHLGTVETRAEPVEPAAAEPSPTATHEPATTLPEPVITADVDADGLRYDPEIHATPKSVTADGLWRAKRGQSEKAAAARAAFKAAGGAVAAPVVAAAAMPGMPGMPTAAPVRAPEPISMDKLLDKTLGMMERAKIDSDGILKLYGVVGIIDPAVLETNETLRAALFGKLCEIEPELY